MSLKIWFEERLLRLKGRREGLRIWDWLRRFWIEKWISFNVTIKINQFYIISLSKNHEVNKCEFSKLRSSIWNIQLQFNNELLLPNDMTIETFYYSINFNKSV